MRMGATLVLVLDEEEEPTRKRPDLVRVGALACEEVEAVWPHGDLRDDHEAIAAPLKSGTVPAFVEEPPVALAPVAHAPERARDACTAHAERRAASRTVATSVLASVAMVLLAMIGIGQEPIRAHVPRAATALGVRHFADGAVARGGRTGAPPVAPPPRVVFRVAAGPVRARRAAPRTQTSGGIIRDVPF
jgi:hypothetical protein